MSEIPAHILEQLHYELDGTISADTEEAKAFVEKMGWNGEEKYRRQQFFASINIINSKAIFFLKIKDIKKSIETIQNELKATFKRFKVSEIFPLGTEQSIHNITTKRVIEEIKKRQELDVVALLHIFLHYHLGNISLDKVYTLYEKELELQKPYAEQTHRIKSAIIDNYFCLKKLKIENLNGNEIYFLGKNGEGKTLILQSFILAAKYIYITNVGNKEILGAILECLNDNLEKDIYITNQYNAVIGAGTTGRYISNIYAYGVHRHQYTGDKNDKDYDSEGFLTLFDSNKKLLSPDKWLLDLRLKELEAKDKGLEVMFTPTTAKKLLENLVKEEDGENTVSIEIDGIKGEVRYTERSGKPLRFHQLSAGYQSVMVWVADLVARMSEKQPEVKELADFEAIVLVDEVGVHLHPQWEYNIMKKLRGWFPKIQFIVTTHSPILLMGASEDAIIYRITKEDGVTKLVGSVPQSELRKMMANQIITSPLFGLDTMAPRSFELQNASNDDFIYQKIHEVIKQRLAENPTLDEDAILKWIEEEMNKLPSHNE